MRARRRVRKQLAFGFATQRRKGRVGRPPKNGKAGVPHLRRPVLVRRFPVHVTMRMHKHVWNLRTRRCFGEIEKAFLKGGERFGFRLIHYSVMGNHIHLLVEAGHNTSLARGMKGLSVRIARALNVVMQRRGSVIADRYHARILRTPTEVKHVRHYLLTNANHHYGLLGADPYASQTPLTQPQTWLLTRAVLVPTVRPLRPPPSRS